MSTNGENRPSENRKSGSTRCPHVSLIRGLKPTDIFQKKEEPCEECRSGGANRWLCVHCLFVGCGERKGNHAVFHAKTSHHQLQMNLKNHRFWCHECQMEICPKSNVPRWTEAEALLDSVSETMARLRESSSPKTRSASAKEKEQRGHAEKIDRPTLQTATNMIKGHVRRSSDDQHGQETVENRDVDDLKSRGRRLIVPTPGPELITVADDDKNSIASKNSLASNGAVSQDSGFPTEKSEASEVRVRQFFVTGRQYFDRDRPTAVVDPNVDFDSSTRDDEPPGLTGLRNLGNTCYMNAALQALSNTIPLTEYFVNCRPVSLALRHNQRCLASDYISLIAEMWSDRRPAFMVPYNVLSFVRLTHPSFRGYQQQDVQEFLRFFLDQLHEDLKQPVYSWECQGDSSHSTSAHAAVRGRESTESTDENGDSSSSSTTSASSGVGDGQSDDGAYRTCDSGWLSDQEIAKRNGVDAEPTSDSPKRKRAALSESLNEVNSDQHIASKCIQTIGHRRPLSVGGGGGDSSDFSDAKQELSPPTSKRAAVGPKRKALRYGSGVPRKKPLRYRSVISDIFDGKLLSSVQCLTCNTVSETKETFQDLSIPIPGREQVEALRNRAAAATLASGDQSSDAQQQQRNGWWEWFASWFSWMGDWMSSSLITLEDCLAAFFSADDLKGDDMYSCDGCKKLRNGVKCCYLQQLPEVLCIHLKRFRHELMFSTKITTRVSFPLDGLDLRPFLHRNAVVPDGECVYDLYAVVCHHGGVEGGHYTAYCLNALNGRWYEFDDQCVTEVDSYIVQSSSAAYVLFYRKRGEYMQSVREETASMLRRVKETLLPQFYISQEWINRFNNMSHPGPITNFDFLCPHGCIDPRKHDFLGDLYAEIPSAVWQSLYKKFGGGPVCSKLLHCVDCNQYYRRLKARREEELQTFDRIDQALKQQNRPNLFYALSTKWFRKWEAFVLSRQEEPPGPIDNGDIVAKKTEKNEFPRIKPGSNYYPVHRELWEFFYASYGGGPEILMATMSSVGHGSRNKSQESLDGQEPTPA